MCGNFWDFRSPATEKAASRSGRHCTFAIDMENYEHIFYLDCPHFTVGPVDQWGEHGYLLYEGMVYWYEVDRKDHCDNARSPQTIRAFLIYAENNGISIPESFMNKLSEVQDDQTRS